MTVTTAPHIVWQDVPGDLALFDLNSGTYHALNGSAAAIWREIAAGADADGVIDRLAERYGAARADIAADVAAFIADALARGLLIQAAA